jgi:hypothetical protein
MRVWRASAERMAPEELQNGSLSGFLAGAPDARIAVGPRRIELAVLQGRQFHSRLPPQSNAPVAMFSGSPRHSPRAGDI